ncbi:MAG: MMPL family transporter [Actinomycetota bacterium]
MSTHLYRLGRSAARHPGRMIAAWAVIAALVIATAGAFGADREDSFEVPGLDSQRAIELLEAAGSDRAGLDVRVVTTPLAEAASFSTADPELVDDLTVLRDHLVELPNVIAVTDPAGALADDPSAAVEAGLVSPDGEVAVLNVRYPVLEELEPADLDRLFDALDDVRVDAGLQIEVAGDLLDSFEETGSGTAELIGLAAAVVILLVAFGSVIAMGLPIALAIAGLALGISLMGLIGHLIEIPSWAPDIATMIGLGVGIDYALFLVTRHRELLSQGHSVEEAAGRATATAGQSVVFAGGTVVIAILGLAVAGVPFMTAVAVSTSAVVAVMVLASITVLPALLGLAGHRIDRFRVHRRSNGTGVGAGWHRWGAHVSRHAVAYAVGVTTLLLALTAPVLALRLGFPDDGTQPESHTSRRAYDLVADGFGPGTNGPLYVVVDLSADGDPAVVDELADAVRRDPGVVDVAATAVDPTGSVASFVAIPTSAPQDEATVETIDRLRSEVFPTVLGDSEVSAHVGGSTANFADIGDRVADRLPVFIAAVVLLSFLLLTLVFRSPVVALKAALLNLLSIGAAYGVLVMVFQWGWGKELIGLETTVPIVSFIPMFMFAILFGLSMDYEVFLLSRVREEYGRSGDNEASVIAGIGTTARVITSAALIMISVFGGFVLSEDPVVKMMGLGLATAILVDATIVRIVLVPATMRLMGDANWWLPGWLDRLLPHVDIDAEPSPGRGPRSPASAVEVDREAALSGADR